MKKLTEVRCTAIQVRIPMFAASKNGSKNLSEVSTQWGCATITGILNKCHRDLLDVLFYSNEFSFVRVNGQGVGCMIQIYKLARLLGADRPSLTDAKRVKRMIEELRVARLEIKTKSGDGYNIITTGIVAKHQYRIDADGKEGKLYGIIFTPEYIALCDNGIKLNWTPAEVQILVRMNSTAATVARFMRSHRSTRIVRYGIETVLEAIGINRDDMSARGYRKRVRQIKNGLDDFRKLGLNIEGKNVIAEPVARQSGTNYLTERNQYHYERNQ